MSQPIAKKKGKIMIFIDNSYIFHNFRRYNFKADYEKLKEIINQNRNLVAIYLYVGLVYPIKIETKKWLDNLKKKSGYVIETHFVKHTAEGVTEKKIDVVMAVDMISNAYENAYDTAILVSGDGDFLPVVSKLKQLNKRVEIWGFKDMIANVLMKEFTLEDIHYIDDFLDDIKLIEE